MGLWVIGKWGSGLSQGVVGCGSIGPTGHQSSEFLSGLVGVSVFRIVVLFFVSEIWRLAGRNTCPKYLFPSVY